jgi:hypothetical protein
MSIGADQRNKIVAFGASGANSDSLQREKLAAQQKDPAVMARIATSEFQGYAGATVSIDAAFFEDGTCVGPDLTGAFATFKAHVDARRDLLQGIVAAQNKGMTSDQIFEYVSSVANSSVMPDPSDRAASYNYFRKIYAQELINVRARQGDEKALAFASSPLQKQWVNLRKQ